MDTESFTAEFTLYIRMLRKALYIYIYWKEHFINKNQYGKLPIFSSKNKSRRMKILDTVYGIPNYQLSTTRSFYGNPHKAKLIEFAGV